MRKISKKQVFHIADLARLSLKAREVEKLAAQLSETLDYVEVLKELDQEIKDLPSTTQVTNLQNVFREDRVRPSLSQKEALSNAKKTYKGYFVTKAIFG